MSRLSALLFCQAPPFAGVATQPPTRASTPGYARAEWFLTWNTTRLVYVTW